MSMNQSSFKKIEFVLKNLLMQAKVIDKQNQNVKSHYMLKEKDLFSNLLFTTQSDKFTPYVNETIKQYKTLKKLINADKNEIAKNVLEDIERKITAINNGLKSNDAMHNEADIRMNMLKSIKQRKYKNAVKNVVQPTQELYQNLSEHHEFERRLMQMINERETQRAQSTIKQAEKISHEILALHQRIGRCRQAISKIERQIEFAEKR